MTADIESFEAAKKARRASVEPALPTAERYLQRAEEALRLLATTTDEAERLAVSRITETWLSLAEATLRPPGRN